MKNGRLHFFPVQEARHLLKKHCEFVRFKGTVVEIIRKDGSLITFDLAERGVKAIFETDILYDETSVEVFINGGEHVISQWLI